MSAIGAVGMSFHPCPARTLGNARSHWAQEGALTPVYDAMVRSANEWPAQVFVHTVYGYCGRHRLGTCKCLQVTYKPGPRSTMTQWLKLAGCK